MQCLGCRLTKDKVSLCCGDQLLCTDCEVLNDRNDRMLSNTRITSDIDNNMHCVEVESTETTNSDSTSTTSELLCFLQNKMLIIAFDDLVKIVTDFYKSDEIESARRVLSPLAETRLPKHQGAVKEKNKRIVTDLLKVCLNPSVQLPKFKAADLSRLPPVNVDHVDISAMMQEIASLRAEVRAAMGIQSELNELRSWLQSMHQANPSAQRVEDMATNTTPARNGQPTRSAAAVVADAVQSGALAAIAQSSDGPSRKRASATPKRKAPSKSAIIGADTSSRVRVVNTVRSIDVFASRLCPSTKAEEIVDSVHSVKGELRVHDVRVEKLVSKREDLYSSYHIEIRVNADQMKQAIDLYMSPHAWPYGVFLRRYFRPKNGGS
jgi:hypothetical protein